MLVTPPRPPPPPAPDSISVLNDSANLDFRTVYANLYRDFDFDNDPYSNVVLSSNYYDMYSLPTQLREHDSPLFLSINIQSLNSKYEELRTQILELQNQKIQIDVVAIQETWEICQPAPLGDACECTAGCCMGHCRKKKPEP